MSQQLSRDQHAQVVKTAHDILQKDIKSRHTSPGSKTIAFHPDVVKHLVDASTWSKLTDSLKMEALVLCLQAYIVCKPKKNRGMSGLGDISFNPNTAVPGNTLSSTRSTPVNLYQNWQFLPGQGNSPTAARDLAQTIFCFQHYAIQSVAGIAPQSVVSFQANPENYRYARDLPQRTGVLSAEDMRWLENLLLLSNGFKFVQTGAAELAILGKIAASKIICSLTWDGLQRKINDLRPDLVALISGSSLIGAISDSNGIGRNMPNPVSNLLVGDSVNTFTRGLATQLRSEAARSAQMQELSSGAQASSQSTLQPNLSTPSRQQAQIVPTPQQAAAQQSQRPITSQSTSQASSQAQNRAQQTDVPLNLRAPIDPSRYREQQRRF